MNVDGGFGQLISNWIVFLLLMQDLCLALIMCQCLLRIWVGRRGNNRGINSSSDTYPLGNITLLLLICILLVFHTLSSCHSRSGKIWHFSYCLNNLGTPTIHIYAYSTCLKVFVFGPDFNVLIWQQDGASCHTASNDFLHLLQQF